MSRAVPAEARVVVPRKRASLDAVLRAALEMTSTCYVRLERVGEGLAVELEEREATGEPLAARFEEELRRLLEVESLERRTGPVRAAMVARAFGPRRSAPRPLPAPTLDPETEAEIERLLAEIERDDWLADSTEIAKTWEERFGDPGGEEEG